METWPISRANIASRYREPIFRYIGLLLRCSRSEVGCGRDSGKCSQFDSQYSTTKASGKHCLKHVGRFGSVPCVERFFLLDDKGHAISLRCGEINNAYQNEQITHISDIARVLLLLSLHVCSVVRVAFERVPPFWRSLSICSAVPLTEENLARGRRFLF